MITYRYRCKKEGHTFEVMQSIKDEPLKTCRFCSGEVERVIFLPTVMVKRDLFEISDREEKKPEPHPWDSPDWDEGEEEWEWKHEEIKSD